MACGEKTELNHRGSTDLTHEDHILIFKLATSGFAKRYSNQFANGMSDGDLWKALQESLGIFGGSGGPNRPSVTYRGSMLRIWGGWEVINHVTTAPLFEGRATVDMAREVYGIANPDDQQMKLF